MVQLIQHATLGHACGQPFSMEVMHSKVLKVQTRNISFGFLYLDHLSVEPPVRSKIETLTFQSTHFFPAGLTYLFLVQAHWPNEDGESKRSSSSQVADVDVEMSKQDQLESL